ncbi:hypothetical protein CYMTET_6901 [Cymbomonas tetramitiformis]|uniref:Uncharacterized protein n=1 Tax=Cymbomonas tetramitiformis TaxID=36881 RepID=A0AAE0GW50_9CHLO|nr:hypothetical protein CYMTET_6901 [Cymbomonas tetramitiformis]
MPIHPLHSTYQSKNDTLTAQYSMGTWSPVLDFGLYSGSNYKLVQHDEMSAEAMRPEQVVVTIEHCSDCSSHPTTTRHNEQRYMTYAAGVKDAIENNFPFIDVSVKATKELRQKESPCHHDGSPCWTMQQECTLTAMPLLPTPAPQPKGVTWPREKNWRGVSSPRYGALEVQMAVWSVGQTQPVLSLLHSKLRSNRWPNYDLIVREIAKRLPAQTLHISVQALDYIDGQSSLMNPVPSGLVITAAAGARVESRETTRREDEINPSCILDVPLGCLSVSCSSSEQTLAVETPIGQSNPGAMGTSEASKLTVTVNSIPQLCISITVDKNASFPYEAASLSIITNVEGSRWNEAVNAEALSEVLYANDSIAENERGQLLWVRLPSVAQQTLDEMKERDEPLKVEITVSIGSGEGQWEEIFDFPIHPYGTSNVKFQIPKITAVQFTPRDHLSRKDVEGGRVQVLSTYRTRDWASADTEFMLLDGSHQVNMKASGYFDEDDVPIQIPSDKLDASSARSMAIHMRKKCEMYVGRELIEVDTIPACMTEGRSIGTAGQVDVAIVFEESVLMAPCILALQRLLGGQSQNSELATFIQNLPLCSSLQMGLLSFRGDGPLSTLSDPSKTGKTGKTSKSAAAAQDGERLTSSMDSPSRKKEKDKIPADLKVPLSANWAGLKAGTQMLEPAGGRDEDFFGIKDALRITAVLGWRPHSARLAVIITDALPNGLSTIGPQEVVSQLGNADVMPETLQEPVRMLRKNGIGTHQVVTGGGENTVGFEEAHCDSAMVKMHKSLAEETGGSLGVITSRGVGFLATVVAATECALHQQLLDDKITSTFSTLLGSIQGQDDEQSKVSARSDLLAAADEISKQLNEEGFKARKMQYHPQSHLIQLLCVPVERHHVVTTIRSQTARGKLTVRPSIYELLWRKPHYEWRYPD